MAKKRLQMAEKSWKIEEILPDDQYTQYYDRQLSYQTEDGSWSFREAVYNRLKEKQIITMSYDYMINSVIIFYLPINELPIVR
ncbi:MAG: hypothetical protein ACI3VZ_00585 [Faecousia sp.]